MKPKRNLFITIDLVNIGELNLKKERSQTARTLQGNCASSLHLPKESWLPSKSGLISHLFENKGIIFIILYISLLLCTIGCIQDNKYIDSASKPEYALSGPVSSGHIVPKDSADPDPNSGLNHSAVPANSAAPANIIDLDPNLHLELDFQSGVSSHLFRSWGTLILWSNGSLPYLVLNATLHNKGRQVSKAKCMLMQIETGKKYSFDISKNMRIPNGDYTCILEALGPFGQITSEKRDCLTFEESADSIFFDEIDAADKSSGNDAMGQYKTEVLKGNSQDKYANNEQPPERNSRISSADMSQESNSDEKKSYASKPDYNPKAGSQDSNPQDLSSGRYSGGFVLGANGTNSDNQPMAAKGNTQITDHDSNELFVGSTGSNKYHRPDCRFVAKIKNKIYYKSAEEAKQDGKVPCKICNPP